MDLEFVSKMMCIHLHAMSRAVTRVLGHGQTFLLNYYAESLVDLARAADLDLESAEGYLRSLRDSHLVDSCSLLAVSPEGVEFRCSGCALAPFVHETSKMKGHTGDLCPQAAMAMIALARELGWNQGEDIFDYVQFSGTLTFFTEDGGRTVFTLPEDDPLA